MSAFNQNNVWFPRVPDPTDATDEQVYAWSPADVAAAASGGGPGSDTTAIHDDTAGEIAAIAAKATPTTSDFLVIEDAADSNNKKSITIGDLPSSGGSSGSWIKYSWIYFDGSITKIGGFDGGTTLNSTASFKTNETNNGAGYGLLNYQATDNTAYGFWSTNVSFYLSPLTVTTRQYLDMRARIGFKFQSTSVEPTRHLIGLTTGGNGVAPNFADKGVHAILDNANLGNSNIWLRMKDASGTDIALVDSGISYTTCLTEYHEILVTRSDGVVKIEMINEIGAVVATANDGGYFATYAGSVFVRMANAGLSAVGTPGIINYVAAWGWERKSP